MKAGEFKEAINAKLQKRSTDQLKNDVVAAMKSDDYGANTIFVVALSILENRLSKEEYNEFEESL